MSIFDFGRYFDRIDDPKVMMRQDEFCHRLMH